MSESPSLGNWNRRREPRLGVMIHYTAGADAGDIEWLTRDERCKVSYNWLVCDSVAKGGVKEIAPPDARAWHAGVCKPSSAKLTYRDANSAFYGIAVSCKPGEKATDYQKRQVARLVRWCFEQEGWTLADSWRITEHRFEAWPRGRKADTGSVLPVEDVRVLIAHG